jgi:hypothetical protein
MRVEAYKRNRRDFIKATAAAAGVVAASSDASAAPASTPWIGFIHSTRLDETWQAAFFEGLREQKWEGDPSENLQAGMARVAIKKFEAGGKYKGTDLSNLSRAIANTIAELGPQLKLVITGGGMASGLAAAGISVPCLVTLGRYFDFGAQRIGGYFFDLINAGTNVNLNKKIDYLHDPSTYNVPYAGMCLLYNGNSWMGAREKDEWTARMKGLGVANPLALDAAGFGSGDNQSIKINRAINNAIRNLNAQAIVVSGDPHMTAKRGKIINAAGGRVIMCYPFLEYADDAGEDGAVGTDKYMAYGPKLSTVYKGLGILAGRFLTTPDMPLSLASAASEYVGKA